MKKLLITVEVVEYNDTTYDKHVCEALYIPLDAAMIEDNLANCDRSCSLLLNKVFRKLLEKELSEQAEERKSGVLNDSTYKKVDE